MSYFDDASLVMIPSGYKDQKVYSVKPIDGSGDLTFSRGSDIEATRVASNGYIEKAAVNLLLQSNSFDTGWTLTSGSSVTSGQSGYDGSSDAWLLTDSGNNSAYCLYRGYTNTGVQTFSIYAKQASTSQIEFDFLGGGAGYLRAELTDGSLHSTLNTIDYKIEDAGGGWWRCSFSANQTSAPTLVRIGCNGAGSVYIQDAQVNYGLVAQEYQETTTTSVVSGITNDMPRLDYSGGASCPSLLLEPSRTNYIKQSSYFGSWLVGGTTPTITTNYGISPEGVQNSTRLQLDTGDLIYESAFSLSTGDYTFSVFGKAINDIYDVDTRLGLRLDIPSAKTAFFDLVNGVVISQTADEAKIEDYGNGWWRCSITQNDCVVNNAVINGNGFDSEIYGAQLEQGSHMTSLIPTYGTSATRTADACSKTGISSLIGQTEGTIFVDFIYDAANTANERLTISDGTSAKRIFMIINTSKLLSFTCTNAGADQWNINTSLTVGQRYKIAGAYKANDITFYVNGVQIGADTSASIPDCSNLYFANENGTTQEWNNPMSQLLLFTSRLSNSDLATLTSL